MNICKYYEYLNELYENKIKKNKIKKKINN